MGFSTSTEGFTDTFKSGSGHVNSIDNLYGESRVNKDIQAISEANTYAQENMIKITEQGSKALSNLENIGSMEQYNELSNAVSNAASTYIQEKIERIQRLWNTTVPVKVKAILDEVAPYAIDFRTASSKLKTRMTSLSSYLLDINSVEDGDWKSLFKTLGKDGLSSILSDQTTQETAANLSIVRAAANGFSAAITTYNIVKKFSTVAQKLHYYVDIFWGYAQRFSEGKGSVSSSTKLKIYAQALVATIIQLTIEAVKKYVYNIEIPLPELLVGGMKSLSVREAVAGYGDISGTWFSYIFDEDYYGSVSSSGIWNSSINNALNSLDNKVSKMQSFVDKVTYLQGTYENRKETEERFKNALKTNYLQQVLEESRKQANLVEATILFKDKFNSDKATYFNNGVLYKSNMEASVARESNLLKNNTLGYRQIIVASKEIYDNLDLD